MITDKLKLVLFLLYTVFYESLVLGSFFYMMIVKEYTLWLIVPMMLLSSAQLMPKHFGLKYKI